jgi:hypothetical protein
VNPLTSADYDLILESLRYTKKAFTEYGGYPDEDYRRMRLEQVDTAVEHLLTLRRS